MFTKYTLKKLNNNLAASYSSYKHNVHKIIITHKPNTVSLTKLNHTKANNIRNNPLNLSRNIFRIKFFF